MQMKLFRKILTLFWFKHFLGNFKWYRRWHGGRWERHWIEPCCSDIWFDMKQGKQWPEYRMPCSHGTPIIEDYPYKHGV